MTPVNHRPPSSVNPPSFKTLTVASSLIIPVLFTVLLGGCDAVQKAMPSLSAATGNRAQTTGNDSTDGQFEALKLSKVTARGIASIGLTDKAALVRWFNGVPDDSDPFLNPMVAEIDGASTDAASIADLKLSSVTVEALASMGITTPAGISTTDRKALKNSRKANDLCRNEIAVAMQRAGWTVLRAEITNRPGATELLLNGVLIGPIESANKAGWRRFLVNAPGDQWDTNVIATLTVNIPNAADGTPPMRWFKDIELVRGGEVRVAIDVATAPMPSIGFAAKTPLSPAAVYAGDSVTLTCEGGSAETVWFTLGSAAELAANNYRTTPSDNLAAAGLPAWFTLRSTAESNASPRSNLLAQPSLQPIIIGRGSTFTWIPTVETPQARICVLMRNDSGFWGFAERSIAVADLRPSLWLMPVLALDPSSLDAATRAVQAVDASPANIYQTHAILDQLLYLAQVGAPATFDLRVDEYRDASLPLAKVSIDFGDATQVVDVAAAQASRAQIKHVYAQAGSYRVTVHTTDTMGFERVHGTNVLASADAPPAPEPAPAAPATVAVSVRVTASAAESSFDLFRRAAGQFARTVATRTTAVCTGRKIGLAHIHEVKDQHLVDLMDGTLVSTLLAHGMTVYEREPLFQYAINARGVLDASTVTVPDQDNKFPELLLSAIAERTDDRGALTGRYLAGMNLSAVPDVDVVVEYKLKRAEVTVVPAGKMLLRTARIFGWVRVHDRKTMQILFDDAVEVSLGGTIAASESTTTGMAWDTYPDGFMIRARLDDTAIEIIEVKTSVETLEAPAVAPTAALSETSTGGFMKSLLGG